MKHLIIFAAGILAITASASHAEPVTTTVSFADLDIRSATGKNVLAQRVANAAATVCGVETGTTDLASHVAARACRAKAIAIAMLAFAMKTTPQYASR